MEVSCCYEKLPNYCYNCGILGHVAEDCEEEIDEDATDWRFGPGLRASPVQLRSFNCGFRESRKENTAPSQSVSSNQKSDGVRRKLFNSKLDVEEETSNSADSVSASVVQETAKPIKVIDKDIADEVVELSTGLQEVLRKGLGSGEKEKAVANEVGGSKGLRKVKIKRLARGAGRGEISETALKEGIAETTGSKKRMMEIDKAGDMDICRDLKRNYVLNINQRVESGDRLLPSQ
ncbi:hypothetical protein M5689_010811 [Euphorbia peplus]|nr:hypothetical protein M5689_010811 [Euphorbia peplus]